MSLCGSATNLRSCWINSSCLPLGITTSCQKDTATFVESPYSGISLVWWRNGCIPQRRWGFSSLMSPLVAAGTREGRIPDTMRARRYPPLEEGIDIELSAETASWHCHSLATMCPTPYWQRQAQWNPGLLRPAKVCWAHWEYKFTTGGGDSRALSWPLFDAPTWWVLPMSPLKINQLCGAVYMVCWIFWVRSLVEAYWMFCVSFFILAPKSLLHALHIHSLHSMLWFDADYQF